MENTKPTELKTPVDYQAQIDSLRKDLDSLMAEVYRNNFSASQDFTKASSFKTKLKIPHYTTLPNTGEVGEIIEVNGRLYICQTPNAFVICGS